MSRVSGSRRSHRQGSGRQHDCPIGPSHQPNRGLSSPGVETIVLLIIAALLIVGAASAGRTQNRPSSWSEVRVQAGDSLWTLAVAHPVEGLTTAQVADLLAGDNRLRGADIVPGDTILVPARQTEQRFAAR